MTELNKETIKNLTQLSRIDCSEEEQAALLEDLKNILHYVEQLQKIDTEHIKPCNHVLDDIANVTREDTVGGILPRDIFLANAPKHSGGMIIVPSIIKQT